MKGGGQCLIAGPVMSSGFKEVTKEGIEARQIYIVIY